MIFLDKKGFGSLLVQVPVEGGYEGGNLHVKYHGKRKVIDNHFDSDTKFYMTVILDQCEHRMEPVTRGSSLILVYNLKWESSKNEMPRDLPAFLFALKEVEQIFRPWAPPPVPTDTQVDKNSGPRIHSSIEEKLLYFHMEGEYEKRITFRDLSGRDQKIALLLQNCPFLEVVVGTVVVIRSENESSNNECPFAEYLREEEGVDENDYQLRGLVDSCDRSINLTFQVDGDKHFSGCGKDFKDAARSSPNDEFKILIVWPKHNTFNFLCRFGLSSLIHRIESSIELFEEKRENPEKQRGELRQLVAALNGGKCPNYSDCVRLLRLCSRLNASQEGLVVLEMLGQSLGKKLPE